MCNLMVSVVETVKDTVSEFLLCIKVSYLQNHYADVIKHLVLNLM